MWTRLPALPGTAHIGTYAAFLEQSNRFYAAAKKALHRAIAGDAAVVGTPDTFFAILDNVSITDRADQHLQRGLFFREKLDLAKFDITAASAVRDGSFPDRAVFESEVEALQERIRRRRLTQPEYFAGRRSGSREFVSDHWGHARDLATLLERAGRDASTAAWLQDQAGSNA